MREHTHLSAMVGFVRNHVAQHLRANRPRLSPAVSVKLLDPTETIAERFRKHIRASGRTRGQSCTGLLRRAGCAIELSWKLQMRCRKPHPLDANIVHVRENCRDRANIARRFGPPRLTIKVLD